MNKIILIIIASVMLSPVALAANEGQNSIFDNLGLSLGIYKQEITTTEPGVYNLNDALTVSGKFDITEVHWYLDGVDTGKHNYNVRSSVYRISTVDLSKLKDANGNQFHDKSGKDPVTKKERHRVTAVFDGGMRTWLMSEN